MRTLYLAMIIGFASVGCNKAKDAAPNDSGAGMAMDSSDMKGMSGMGRSGMMATIPAHMDSMMQMPPGRMSQMMPGHERRMSQMMDQMGSEMRQMKMAETPEWSALSDSVRQDLAELPVLEGQALAARMRAHADRVQRLMREHEQMMKGMH
jgi:hypothetical protein